jgi:transcriptional regulator with XRE-family HTH domain
LLGVVLCGIVPKMGTNAVQRDTTAEAVGNNVKRLRTEQNLGLRALADRLESIRSSIKYTTIDAIERGTRRVDVDDLMALALALRVTPVTLLMPATDSETALVTATGIASKVTAEQLWLWLAADLSGASVVGLSPAAFLASALPSWQQPQWLNLKGTGSDGDH